MLAIAIGMVVGECETNLLAQKGWHFAAVERRLEFGRVEASSCESVGVRGIDSDHVRVQRRFPLRSAGVLGTQRYNADDRNFIHTGHDKATEQNESSAVEWWMGGMGTNCILQNQNCNQK